MAAQHKTYTCIIVDDEPLARELIETHLGHFDQFSVLASCASAIEASRVLNEQRVDLMFLDIEMPVMKGTEFLKSLKNPPKVIFTTAYREYAVDGFDLEAVDYLLKPVVFARFFKSIERFLEMEIGSRDPQQMAVEPEKHLFVRKDRKDVKLVLNDIVYVRSLRDYLEVHTIDAKHIIKSGIAEFYERLGEDFIRIHRSYLVNANRVTAVTRNDVELCEIELPIGEHYRKVALARFGIS